MPNGSPSHPYNSDLCRELHRQNDRAHEGMEDRIGKCETRMDEIRTWLIATLTSTVITLLGVIAVFVKMAAG